MKASTKKGLTNMALGGLAALAVDLGLSRFSSTYRDKKKDLMTKDGNEGESNGSTTFETIPLEVTTST
jgi:hypothetical protein